MMGSMNPGMYSSATGEWETPQDLYDFLDARFHFTLDPCATASNAKCPEFITKEMDGLSQRWDGRVFMNPPYGRQIGKWVAKAFVESNLGCEIVVALLPARTDTTWWHEYVMKADEVYLIKGRLNFSSYGPAPFPSCIVVFSPKSRPPSAGELVGVLGEVHIELGRIRQIGGEWQWS